MKQQLTILTTLAMVFLITLPLCAQTFVDGNSGLSSTEFGNRAAQQSVLSSQLIASPNTTQNISVSNKVFVQQIGNNNNVNSTTRSIASDVNVLQRGNSNAVNQDITAGLISENLVQYGNNHSFLGLTDRVQRLYRANVFQRGSNQNLVWLGSNSISERMTINMSGQGKTVIVRNIKR